MTTLRAQITIGGVLADVAGVTLSDAVSGAVYGVRRTDTGAVVVAAGTAMTRVSAGIYEYEYSDSPGLPYEWRFAAIYGGETYIGGGTWTADVTPAAAVLDLSEFDELDLATVEVQLADYGVPVTVHPIGGADRDVRGIMSYGEIEMKEQPRAPTRPVFVALPNDATTGITLAEWNNRFEITAPPGPGAVALRMRTIRAFKKTAAMITWELG
jgi:hypothetical protein